MPNDKSFVVDIEATVEVRDAHLAPKLVFSFPGLGNHEHLWTNLGELGWDVPPRPPHPEPEIDWDNPKQGYAVLPYDVEEFVVEAPEWPNHLVAERGLETINMLRRLGVDLHIPVAYLDFLRRTQVALLRDPARNKPVLKPTTIPQTIFLSKQPWASLIDDKSIEVYETAAGVNQPNWYWAESELHVEQLFDNEERRTQVLRSIGHGWELVSRMEAPPALDGRDRILRFIVRDVRDGSAMLEELKDVVGDACASLLMRPIRQTDAVDNCLLVVAVLPRNQFSEIGQSLIARFSDAIGRGRRHVPATGQNAA